MVALLTVRIDKLAAAPARETLVAREGAFFVNNLLLVALMFTVLIGTLHPIFAESVRGIKVSVGAPYFNRMAIPLFLSLLLLMGVGPALPWGTADRRKLRRALLLPLPAAAAAAVLGWALGARGGAVLLTCAFAGYALWVTADQGLRPARQRVKKGDAIGAAATTSLLRAPRRIGAYIVHFGVIVVFVAVAISSAFQSEREARLAPGDTLEIEGYTLRLARTDNVQQSHRIEQRAEVEVARGGRDLATLAPSLNHYPTQMDPVATPAVRTSHHARSLPDADERRCQRFDRTARDRDAGRGVDLDRRVRHGGGHRDLSAAAAPRRRGPRLGRRERAPGAGDGLAGTARVMAPRQSRSSGHRRADRGAAGGLPRARLRPQPGGHRVDRSSASRRPSSCCATSAAGSVDLASLRGKPVVVNFWASWCQPCVAEHPVLVEAARRYGAEVVFVGVVPLEDTARSGGAFHAAVREVGTRLSRRRRPRVDRLWRVQAAGDLLRIERRQDREQGGGTARRTIPRRPTWRRCCERRAARRRARRWRSLLGAAAIGVGGAGGVGAAEKPPGQSLDEAAILGPPQGRPLEGAELDAATRALGERMRCPVCQGMAIADSPSASALAMMSQVRDLLARGYTEEQVLDYFVRSYGEFVLLEPTTKGFNLVVWLLPLAGVAAGAVLIVLRLRAGRPPRARPGRPSGGGDRAASGADPGDPDLDRYVERVRSEVGS